MAVLGRIAWSKAYLYYDCYAWVRFYDQNFRIMTCVSKDRLDDTKYQYRNCISK